MWQIVANLEFVTEFAIDLQTRKPNISPRGGELQQAKDYHENAMGIYINVLGPNHIDVATSYGNLSWVYEALDEPVNSK